MENSSIKVLEITLRKPSMTPSPRACMHPQIRDPNKASKNPRSLLFSRLVLIAMSKNERNVIDSIIINLEISAFWVPESVLKFDQVF